MMIISIFGASLSKSGDGLMEGRFEINHFKINSYSVGQQSRISSSDFFAPPMVDFHQVSSGFRLDFN